MPAAVLRARSPRTRVVAVAAAGAPAMVQSLQTGTLVTTSAVDTIADGVAVRVPVPEALADLDGLVDDLLLVDDAHTLAAMRALVHDAGVLVEPAGALGVAALLANARAFAGAHVATVLCGANVTEADARNWLFA